MIEGKHFTIAWYVDDNKAGIAHQFKINGWVIGRPEETFWVFGSINRG